MNRPPKTLKKPGRELWKWLTSNYEMVGCEPLAVELCSIQDRLAEIREVLARDGVQPGTDASKKHPLLDSEVKLSGQFMRIWRVLGLADNDEPKRGPGRPTNSERGLPYG